MNKRLPASFYNITTIFGATLAFVMLIIILFLFVIDALSGFANTYMGLITYIALPGVMLFGLFLAAVGMIRTSRRMRRGEQLPELPIIDLNVPRQRALMTSFAVGGLILMALSGFGSYQAYHYTESVQFCGTTCHDVMKPEYVAYQHSPHAKVSCAGCHIGSGATWYVRSKLSGAYQVYSTIFNKYDRPIKTPIENLRPAQETCEECHWPRHFYSQKLKERSYFLSDPENSRSDIEMLVKVGGTQAGVSDGIHAHMYLDYEISYIASDDKRQEIPYVEARSPDGKVTIYRDTESKLSDDEVRKLGKKRVVDCIDCHNRPTHIFRHPETSVNQAMLRGMIDPTIPEIKSVAVQNLEKPYKTEKEALASIDKEIRAYYQENYKDDPNASPEKLNKAIRFIQDVYKTNYFPEMKVSWKSSINNLDHIHSKGCFRCHDDKHVSDTGKVISKNCQSCHSILAQKLPGEQKVTKPGQEFRHPVDIGDAWKTSLCMDCHGKQDEE